LEKKKGSVGRRKGDWLTSPSALPADTLPVVVVLGVPTDHQDPGYKAPRSRAGSQFARALIQKPYFLQV
jgi:hypothetical protein